MSRTFIMAPGSNTLSFSKACVFPAEIVEIGIAPLAVGHASIVCGVVFVGFIKEGSAGFVIAQWEFVAAWCAFSARFVV